MDKPRPQVLNNAVRNELVNAQSVNGGSNPDTTTIDTDTNIITTIHSRQELQRSATCLLASGKGNNNTTLNKINIFIS